MGGILPEQAIFQKNQPQMMRPLGDLSAEALRRVDFVMTDIDDTLTTDGRLPAIAYEALERLTARGLKVIPVTGRPAGWCDLIARLWPVSAVIGENGAFYFTCKAKEGVTRVFDQPDETRHNNRLRLDELAKTILKEVSGARLSADQAFREVDLAIDFAEDGPHLPKEDIRRIVECFENAGAMAKVSSIHVNGWFGHHDKLAMTRRLFAEQYGMDIEAESDRVLFVGDSPNDAPMFGFFENSVAVANFIDFQDEVEELPKWLTRSEGGAGFAEVAAAILLAKTS